MNLDEDIIAKLAEKVRREVKRSVRFYRIKEIDLNGKDVLLVDDGFTTGYTAIAGIMMLRKTGAKRIYAAAPCAPLDTVLLLRKYADDVFILQKFGAFTVTNYYQDFRELSDEDVLKALKEVDP